MKERPILFSEPMVRALLAGTKTQTRRVVKPQPETVVGNRIKPWEGEPGVLLELMESFGRRCPYGQPGDRIWVKEAHRISPGEDAPVFSGQISGLLRWPHVTYADATTKRCDTPWQGVFGKLRPSIHMPRWASRIDLDITDIRVERLQDISEADAVEEGIQEWIDGGIDHDGYPRDAFRSLWESINGPGSWGANPWVWVVKFEMASK